jgi:hypothetical protein
MRRMGVLAMMTLVLVGFEAGPLGKWLVLKKARKDCLEVSLSQYSRVYLSLSITNCIPNDTISTQLQSDICGKECNIQAAWMRPLGQVDLL